MLRINGSLSHMFKGMDISNKSEDEIRSMVIGVPIKNEDGCIMGEIVDIDLTNDKYIADVWCSIYMNKRRKA